MTNDLALQETETVSAIDASLAGTITRAEIDTLIGTARAYPRSLSRAQQRMLELATMDEEAAEECVYSLPRGGKTLEGPSIRFAELVAQSFGNSRVAARTTVVDRAEMYVEAEGFFLDAETNVATLARIRRSIRDSKGRCYNADMINVTSNAAQSIARRNAILAGVPKAVWRKPYEAARRVIMGDIETLANRRAAAIKSFQRFGLTEAQVLALMAVKGVEDIDLEKLVPLRGMYAALQNQEITVEELLRAIEPEKERPARVTPTTASKEAPAAFAASGLPSADGPAAAAEPATKPDTPPTEPVAAAEKEPAKEPANVGPDAPTLFATTSEIDDRDIVVTDVIAALEGCRTATALEGTFLNAEDELAGLDQERRAKVEAAYQAKLARLSPRKKKAATS